MSSDILYLKNELEIEYAGQKFLTVKFSLEGYKLIVKRKNIFKTYFKPQKYRKR